jgi:hypothetical protein
MAEFDELGVETSLVNTTRLKESILLTFPEISAHSQGRDIILASDRNVGDAIRNANKQDPDVDAMHLAKATKIVRKEILKHHQPIKGTFPPDCQDISIPPSLKAIVCMTLKGPGSRHTAIEEVNSNQASRSISQLIIYNTNIRHEIPKLFNPSWSKIEDSALVARACTGQMSGRTKDKDFWNACGLAVNKAGILFYLHCV